MMLSEFEKLTGLEVTTAEYEKIEAEYMESPDDKAKFCKMWLKKGGLQRLHNARLEEIEHLKKTIEDLEHKLDEEQDWQISHKYGTHYQKSANHWLQRQDRQRDAVMAVLKQAYGEHAALWFQRWRMFWMSCAELFGYADGQEWLVAHYRFVRP